MLLSAACNTGLEPLLRGDGPALQRDCLSWVDQNYSRDDTLEAAKATWVAAQSRLTVVSLWGGGEVAAADGRRFVVPVRTVHADPKPQDFGVGRGVTWSNLIAEPFAGWNAITVPGTLRERLIRLALVLEPQTALQLTRSRTDTGAYSDVVFGFFRLLGERFSPRLAAVGGSRRKPSLVGGTAAPLTRSSGSAWHPTGTIGCAWQVRSNAAACPRLA